MSNSQSGIITDPRFASLHHDPRFSKHNKHGAKESVDARFAAVLDDPRFQDKKVNRNNKRPRTQDIPPTDNDNDGPLSNSTSLLSSSSSSISNKNIKNNIPEQKNNRHNTTQEKVSKTKPPHTALSATHSHTSKVSGNKHNKNESSSTDDRFHMAAKWQNDDDDDDDDDDDTEEEENEDLLAEYSRALQEDDEENSDDDDDDDDNGNDSFPTGKRTTVSKAKEPSPSTKKNKFAQETVQERLERLSRMARGEASDSGSEAASSSESEYEEMDEDDDAYAEKVVMDLHGPEIVQDPEAPNLQNIEYREGDDIDKSSRLALVNCDWDHLRAIDIMASLQSFLPPGRSIVRVDIYYSDYGLKRLHDENIRGPQNIFKYSGTSETTATQSGKSSGTKPKSTGTDLRPSNPFHSTNKTEEEAFDPERLRQYELNKMKYFFAIISFDSALAADSVYKQCDGIEIESTSNVLDLRVVPSDQSFKDRKVFDSATQVPDTYQPPTFHTRALQSSRIELTWDGDDPQRNQALDWDRLAKTKKKDKKEIRKGRKRRDGDDDEDDDDDNLANLKNYLASSESEEEEEEEDIQEAETMHRNQVENDNDDSPDDNDDTNSIEKNSTTKLSKKEARLRARAKYRALLFGESTKSSSKKRSERTNKTLTTHGTEDEGEDENELEEDDELADKSMTFIPGAGEAVLKAKADRETREQESSFEAFQRKRKEKKKVKKAAWKASLDQRNSESSSNIQHIFGTKTNQHTEDNDDNLEDDTFFTSSTGNKKSSKKSKGKSDDVDDDSDQDDAVDKDRKNTAAYKRAQLELLGIGDDNHNDDNDEGMDSDRDTKSSKNYNLASLLKEQKLADKAAKKSQKQHAKTVESKVPVASSSSDFNVDVHDSRFAAVFNAPEYSIDPTAPQYKDTSGMRKILNSSTGGTTGSTKKNSLSSVSDNTTSRPMVVIRGNPSSTATMLTGSTSTKNDSHTDTANDVRKLAENIKTRFAKK